MGNIASVTVIPKRASVYLPSATASMSMSMWKGRGRRVRGISTLTPNLLTNLLKLPRYVVNADLLRWLIRKQIGISVVDAFLLSPYHGIETCWQLQFHLPVCQAGKAGIVKDVTCSPSAITDPSCVQIPRVELLVLSHGCDRARLHPPRLLWTRHPRGPLHTSGSIFPWRCAPLRFPPALQCHL